MAAGAKDAWEVVVIILEGLECSTVHKEEQWFGRKVEHWLALKTCC